MTVTFAPEVFAVSRARSTTSRRGEAAFRRADAHVHPHLRARHQEGMAHVVAGVAEVREADVPPRLAARLPHRHEVGEHLGRVPLVGEAVETGTPA